MNAKMTAADAASFIGVTLQAIHKQLKTKKLDFKKTKTESILSIQQQKKFLN